MKKSSLIDRTFVGSIGKPPLTFVLGFKLGEVLFLMKKAVIDINAGIKMSKNIRLLEHVQNMEVDQGPIQIEINEESKTKTLIIKDDELLNKNSIYLILSDHSVPPGWKVVLKHSKEDSHSCELCNHLDKSLNLKHKNYSMRNMISPEYISHILLGVL